MSHRKISSMFRNAVDAAAAVGAASCRLPAAGSPAPAAASRLLLFAKIDAWWVLW